MIIKLRFRGTLTCFVLSDTFTNHLIALVTKSGKHVFNFIIEYESYR